MGGGAGDGQVGVREAGQGDVPVPGVVAADLVVVQTDLALGGVEGLLDRPAGSGDRDQVGQRALGRTKAQVMGQFAVGEAAADQQLVPPGLGQQPDRNSRPVIQPGPLAPAPADSRCQAEAGTAAEAASTRHWVRPAAPVATTYWLTGTASTYGIPRASRAARSR